jgi:glutamine amidotransferase
MTKAVAIIDYGVGNLRSVRNAFAAVEVEATILSSPRGAGDYARIVIPGVGAFADGMQRLAQTGWLDWLQAHGKPSGRPILGLCLGMQLMATLGHEHGVHKGLGWIDGEVIAINDQNGTLRVPHMGWNEVVWRERSHPWLQEVKDNASFYFVHSYALRCEKPFGVCDYGDKLTAAIVEPPFYGTQFHPEKSQKAGLQMLANFARMPA